jgi:hypothetical protein
MPKWDPIQPKQNSMIVPCQARSLTVHTDIMMRNIFRIGKALSAPYAYVKCRYVSLSVCKSR